MDKSLCTTLYEIDQDKFTYSHAYHKIIFASNHPSPDIKKPKQPQNFQFEEIQRTSIDFSFKAQVPKLLNNTFQSSKSKNAVQIKTRKIIRNTFNRSFITNSDFVQNMRIRGSSASLLKRKHTSQSQSHNKKQIAPNTIYIRIKKLVNKPNYLLNPVHLHNNLPGSFL